MDVTVTFSTNIRVTNVKTGELLVNEHNAVHPQNMSRVISRALRHENNYFIYRMALGNGATFAESSGSIVYRAANDGTNGEGWQSRLYNEVYSEIVDETNVLLGTDPGSADASGIRIGGGASPANDLITDSVISNEVGNKSTVTITMYLNSSEPATQSATLNGNSKALTNFTFDEFGLYTSGKQARDTPGYSTVNVGDKVSSDNSLLSPSAILTLNLSVDGMAKSTTLTVPFSGSGPNGEITFGDICEGINSGQWITSGDPINSMVYFYITDYSNGTYPSIINTQSFGLFTLQSKTTGVVSSINILCNSTNGSDFFNALTAGICGNVNFTSSNGGTVGVQNKPSVPQDERERLLTHFIFAPIIKTVETPLKIEYTITTRVAPTVKSSSSVTINTI